MWQSNIPQGERQGDSQLQCVGQVCVRTASQTLALDVIPPQCWTCWASEGYQGCKSRVEEGWKLPRGRQLQEQVGKRRPAPWR